MGVCLSVKMNIAFFSVHAFNFSLALTSLFSLLWTFSVTGSQIENEPKLWLKLDTSPDISFCRFNPDFSKQVNSTWENDLNCELLKRA